MLCYLVHACQRCVTWPSCLQLRVFDSCCDQKLDIHHSHPSPMAALLQALRPGSGEIDVYGETKLSPKQFLASLQNQPTQAVRKSWEDNRLAEVCQMPFELCVCVCMCLHVSLCTSACAGAHTRKNTLPPAHFLM